MPIPRWHSLLVVMSVNYFLSFSFKSYLEGDDQSLVDPVMYMNNVIYVKYMAVG